MPNAWKKEKSSPFFFSLRGIFLLSVILLLFLIIIFLRPLSSQNPNPISLQLQTPVLNLPTGLTLLPFDCAASPQASPVFAARVEGLHYPFLYSLADFGSLPDKPHKNIIRMLKGKPFRRPDISSTIQEFLRGSKPADGIVIDVGANVGMAAFAAAAMGFRVVAIEPVFENLQRICDGVFLNRFWDRVVIFEAAASDRMGNITLHKNCKYPNIIGCLYCSQDHLKGLFFDTHRHLSDFNKLLDQEIHSCGLVEGMINNTDIFGLSSFSRQLIGEGSHRQLVNTMVFQNHPKFTQFFEKHFCEANVIVYLLPDVFSDPFEPQHLVRREVLLFLETQT